MGVKRSFISHGKKKKEKEKECCESDRTQKVRGNPRNREGFVTHISLEMKHEYIQGSAKRSADFATATASQGQAKQLSKSRKKFIATTYKPFSRSLYNAGAAAAVVRKNHSRIG